VTIQAKSGLKDTIISDNEETLEGFVQNGGKCPTIVVQLGRGSVKRRYYSVESRVNTSMLAFCVCVRVCESERGW